MALGYAYVEQLSNYTEGANEVLNERWNHFKEKYLRGGLSQKHYFLKFRMCIGLLI